MENKKLDGMGLAGVIVNVVIIGLESISYLVLCIVGFVIVWNDGMGLLYILISLIMGTLSIITLIFNAKVLAGELKYKHIASILGFICFSILGSVLLLISKDNLKKESELELLNALKKFKELYDSDVITEEEFILLKRKLIGD